MIRWRRADHRHDRMDDATGDHTRRRLVEMKRAQFCDVMASTFGFTVTMKVCIVSLSKMCLSAAQFPEENDRAVTCETTGCGRKITHYENV